MSAAYAETNEVVRDAAPTDRALLDLANDVTLLVEEVDRMARALLPVLAPDSRPVGDEAKLAEVPDETRSAVRAAIEDSARRVVGAIHALAILRDRLDI